MNHKISLPAPHPAQAEILKHPARFKVLVCGRRFGKSTLALIALAETALRGGTCWAVCPNYPQSTEFWAEVKRRLGPVAKKTESLRRLEFPGGGSITVRSGHEPDSLRGVGLDLAVLDEAGYMDESVWTGAIRPSLSDTGGRAMLLSTPNGLNWLYTAFLDGQDPDVTDWQSWQLPTSASPFIDWTEIEKARERLPSLRFQQEYLAEFTESAGAVFRNVPEVCVGQREPAQWGHVYQVGVDWGRVHDYTVFSVIDTSVTPVRQVWLERYTETTWDLQRDRLIDLYGRYKPAIIWAESNSIGQPQIEALQGYRLPVKPFYTTSASKPPLIEGMALAFERGDVILLDDKVQKGELLAYMLEQLPGGTFRYSAPAGMHDDCVIALALALYRVVTNVRKPIEVTTLRWA